MGRGQDAAHERIDQDMASDESRLGTGEGGRTGRAGPAAGAVQRRGLAAPSAGQSRGKPAPTAGWRLPGPGRAVRGSRRVGHHRDNFTTGTGTEPCQSPAVSGRNPLIHLRFTAGRRRQRDAGKHRLQFFHPEELEPTRHMGCCFCTSSPGPPKLGDTPKHGLDSLQEVHIPAGRPEKCRCTDFLQVVQVSLGLASRGAGIPGSGSCSASATSSPCVL